MDPIPGRADDDMSAKSLKPRGKAGANRLFMSTYRSLALGGPTFGFAELRPWEWGHWDSPLIEPSRAGAKRRK